MRLLTDANDPNGVFGTGSSVPAQTSDPFGSAQFLGVGISMRGHGEQLHLRPGEVAEGVLTELTLETSPRARELCVFKGTHPAASIRSSRDLQSTAWDRKATNR